MRNTVPELPSIEQQHRMVEYPPVKRTRPTRKRLLPIHGRVTIRLRHKTPASLLTHVMAVPGDGIRRTGRARVNIRLGRTEVPAKLLAQPAHVNALLAGQVVGWPTEFTHRRAGYTLTGQDVEPRHRVTLAGAR